MANYFTGFISSDKAAEIFGMPQVAIKLYSLNGKAADTMFLGFFCLHCRTAMALKLSKFMNKGTRVNPLCTHLELH